MPHINHPNYEWAITADDLKQVENNKLFEIYNREMTITIKQEGSSKYRTLFIGKGGRILKEAITNPAVYQFRGDETYVRAKIIESNGKLAWTQPVWFNRKSDMPTPRPLF